MGHSRAEGHEVQASTTPDDGIYLTQAVTRGEFDDPATGTGEFTLGAIVGNLQGDMLLTVTFADGEKVSERLDMSGLLNIWVGEIGHSKRMRDKYPLATANPPAQVRDDD